MFWRILSLHPPPNISTASHVTSARSRSINFELAAARAVRTADVAAHPAPGQRAAATLTTSRPPSAARPCALCSPQPAPSACRITRTRAGASPPASSTRRPLRAPAAMHAPRCACRSVPCPPTVKTAACAVNSLHRAQGSRDRRERLWHLRSTSGGLVSRKRRTEESAAHACARPCRGADAVPACSSRHPPPPPPPAAGEFAGVAGGDEALCGQSVVARALGRVGTPEWERAQLRREWLGAKLKGRLAKEGAGVDQRSGVAAVLGEARLS
ncbi:hypothetical protein GGX14DRAFT_572445 [Mycena pura]|uniref:Uncharacterized protein n=1 Tax=Mycena pura TaxID=153505 RepID=A0AAD6V3U6_9AGAR|nr:hypothetical protein GGX14DRAFT_572445 [Mycena pura]